VALDTSSPSAIHSNERNNPYEGKSDLTCTASLPCSSIRESSARDQAFMSKPPLRTVDI
jgi:hypothetical protein